MHSFWYKFPFFQHNRAFALSIASSMRRKFSDAFKQQVLAEHVQGRLSLSEIARKYDIEVRLLKSWMNGRESGIPMTGEHLQK